ncbi:MAG TPA: hypothetical protein VMC10_18435 [Stellaceae bacterium]|nr:hypothetical protein [Stellaceae bacterium]
MVTLKRSTASLIGGIAVGFFLFVLTLLIAGGPTPVSVTVGLLVAVLVGTWVRLADL